MLIPRAVWVPIILVTLAAVAAPSPARAQGSRDEGYAEFVQGAYALAAGQIPAAVEHFQNAWRLSDHDPDVGRRLAEAYYLAKDFARCETVADDVLKRVPNDADALLLKAKVRYIRRDPRGAVECLERAEKNGGASFEVERLLGTIYYEMGEGGKALAAYQRCLEVDPYYPTIQYRVGRLLAAQGRNDDAEAAFRRALDIDPDFVDPALALAELLRESDRGAEAIPVLEQVVARDSTQTQPAVALGELYLEAGRYDDGVRLLEHRQSLGREGEIVLGRLHYERGDYDAARGVFEHMLEQTPKSPELERILGEIEIRSGHPKAGRAHFDRAITDDPSDYRSYLALFLAISGRYGDAGKVPSKPGEAAALLGKAAEHLPAGDFDADYLLGVSYMRVDSLDSAERYLLRARELNGDDYDTLFNLASLYEKRKQYEKAIDCLQHLYELKPDDAPTLNFYGYLLALAGKDLDKAEGLVKKALTAEPKNGYYLDSLGWVYYQMGDYKRAVVQLEKASQLAKDDAVILEHLGDAYAALRRFNEARAAYERSHELQGDNVELLHKIESTTHHTE